MEAGGFLPVAMPREVDAIRFGEPIAPAQGSPCPALGHSAAKRIGALAQSNALAIGEIEKVLLDHTAIFAGVRNHSAACGHNPIMRQTDSEGNRDHVAGFKSISSC